MDTLGPKGLSYCEGVYSMEGFVECKVIMFGTDNTVHSIRRVHVRSIAQLKASAK